MKLHLLLINLPLPAGGNIKAVGAKTVARAAIPKNKAARAAIQEALQEKGAEFGKANEVDEKPGKGQKGSGKSGKSGKSTGKKDRRNMQKRSDEAHSSQINPLL